MISVPLKNISINVQVQSFSSTHATHTEEKYLSESSYVIFLFVSKDYEMLYM